MKNWQAIAIGVLAIAPMASLPMMLIGCPAAVPVVGPVASCVSTVIADALKGDSIAQILADAGPACVTSAEEVITILLGSSDPAVQQTPAFAEATAKRGKK